MPRRHPATVLLALATLLGLGGPAAAEAPRTRLMDEAERLPERPSAPAEAATTPPVEAGSSDAASSSETASTREAPPSEATRWMTLVEERLAALHEAALDHADRRPTEAAASSALLRRLEALARGMHRAAALGIAVRELDTGAPVFEWHAELGLNPASNHKLLTAVAALELLGEDYRFETRVLQVGDALVIVGEGDPSLQVDDLERLADAVAGAVDLHAIRRVIVDDTAFSPRRFGPGYADDGPGVSYMAPSGALSLQWNTIEIDAVGAPAGQPVRVRVSPPCEHVAVRSSSHGGRGSLSVRTRAEGERTVVDVRGHLRAGTRTSQRRRVTDPGRFTGTVFAAMLQRRGADPALAVERGSTPEGATPVATHRSEALPQVLGSALSYSNNFSTEQVLRTLGWRMTGEPGDWDNGRLALERYWDAAGLSPHELRFENGSGLSTQGRITAAALAELLALSAREGSPAAALWSVLPVAGREGTLRGRLRGSGGRVRAKTGTLYGASALSGMVEAKGGRRLGFSILVNGPVSPTRSRRLQDQVVMALLEHGATG